MDGGPRYCGSDMRRVFPTRGPSTREIRKHRPLHHGVVLNGCGPGPVVPSARRSPARRSLPSVALTSTLRMSMKGLPSTVRTRTFALYRMRPSLGLGLVAAAGTLPVKHAGSSARDQLLSALAGAIRAGEPVAATQQEAHRVGMDGATAEHRERADVGKTLVVADHGLEPERIGERQ